MPARLMELPQHLIDSWADELTIEEVLSSVSDVSPSKYIAKWKCINDINHSYWHTTIKARIHGTECKKCAVTIRNQSISSKLRYDYKVIFPEISNRIPINATSSTKINHVCNICGRMRNVTLSGYSRSKNHLRCAVKFQSFKTHPDYELIKHITDSNSTAKTKIITACTICNKNHISSIISWLNGQRAHHKCAVRFQSFKSHADFHLISHLVGNDSKSETKISPPCVVCKFPHTVMISQWLNGNRKHHLCAVSRINVRLRSSAADILSLGAHGNPIAAYNLLLGMKASSKDLRRYRTMLGMTQAGMPANKAIELITGMPDTDGRDDGPDELPVAGPESLLPQPPPDLPTPAIRKLKSTGGEPFTIAGTKALIGTINAIASKHPIDDEKVVRFIIDSMVGSFWEKYCEAEIGDRKGVAEVVKLLQAERSSPNKLMVEIAERFMREHDGALQACRQLPRWFSPKDAAGHRIELRMMQRLVAYQLTAGGRQRFANWSAPGAGKTLAALLAGLLLGSRLTVVICPNLVIPSWQDQIARTFARGRAAVEVKQFTPSDRCTHLVVNYDLMQGDKEKVQRQIDAFCERHGEKVGLLVIDEVHRAKNDGEINQGDEKSARRDAIDYLISKLPAAKVLVQTGTPVLTGCAEGASILELVEPGAVQNYGLQRRDSFDECSRLRIGILRNGVRFKPRIGVQLLAPAIERRQGGEYCQSKNVGLDIVLPDGRQDLAPLIHIDDQRAIRKLYELRDKRWSWLDMDMILTPFKLKAIVAALRRGTVVYTEHVGTERDQPIVDMLARTAQRAGFSTAICDGRPSSVRGHSPENAALGRCRCPRCEGLAGFRRGKVDILVASRTIGEGVDGLQHAGNRVVINAPPWHDAAWDQLIGRWYRAGQKRDVEVVVPITWMHPQDRKQEGKISLDVLRLGRIYDRGTISDAVLDGCLPTHVGGAAEIVRQAKIELEKLAKK